MVQELAVWNPPIACRVDAENTGRLFIDKVELLPYLDCCARWAMRRHRRSSRKVVRLKDLESRRRMMNRRKRVNLDKERVKRSEQALERKKDDMDQTIRRLSRDFVVL